MDSLIHLPLEPYKSRYTEWLQEAEQAAFARMFAYRSVIPPEQKGVLNINTGRVLDSYQRPYWCLDQIKMLLATGAYELGRVYLSDFYTSGLDAVPYSGTNARISSFLWAQTFDKYDFTCDMIDWMRPWEIMAFEIYENVFVACELLRELIIAALPHVAEKVFTVGLPFDSQVVAARFDPKEVPADGYDCVYSSRWDKEKNPCLFLDLVMNFPDKQFAICTGSEELRGNDFESVERAKRLASTGKNLTIFTGCSKGRYYAILTKCAVQFNSANQDWVSYTLLEALTFGCAPLYPNHRSFPDVLMNYEPCLYRPYSIDDAADKFLYLLDKGFPEPMREAILGYHNNALYQIADIIRR